MLIREGGAFRMPGGFQVHVELLDRQDAKDQMGGKILAQYSQDDHIISLKRARSTKQRRADLAHELQHCCVDWIDHFLRKARL